MIYTAIDNFYVSEEQLEDTPSRRDGISKEIETQLRIYGCEVIQEGGILLKLPQAVMATGQVLLQRFYVKESMLKFNIKRVAWACCWLATKLEENPRRIRDLLSVFHRVDHRREGKSLQCLDLYGQEYAMFKKELVHVERHLLRTFGFVLHVDHPHKFVLNYLNILKAGPELKQEAWNLANDSLRTTLSVRFRGETVACGIIFLASRRLQEPLPENPAWWDLFRVSKEDMYTVACQVHALFSMPKVQYVSVYRSSKTLQSPSRSEAAKVQLSSSATANGTPNEVDSDTGVSQPAATGPGSAEAADRDDAGESMAVDAKAPDSHKKEKRKRSKHDKYDEGREEEGDRHRRRYRRREHHTDDDSEQDGKYGRQDRSGSDKRERRSKEGARDRDRDRARDGEAGPRSREKDRGRDSWDRKRDDRRDRS